MVAAGDAPDQTGQQMSGSRAGGVRSRRVSGFPGLLHHLVPWGIVQSLTVPKAGRPSGRLGIHLQDAGSWPSCPMFPGLFSQGHLVHQGADTVESYF